MPKNTKVYKFRDIKYIYNTEVTKQALLKAEKEGRIPESQRVQYGNSSIQQRTWTIKDLPFIGEKYGFLNKPSKHATIAIYASKGGVLKSSTTLNIARMYALHNVKTCVIDLDPQADSSRNLGFDIPEESVSKLSELDNYYEGIQSLSDLYNKKTELKDIIQSTEIPTLDAVLATAELIPLMDKLNSELRREYWLKDNVIIPLQEMGYEMIIMDLAPSWSIYTTNAIVASDILLSPLECRIAHYRNSKQFIGQIENFSKSMKLKSLRTAFIPTKVSHSRKISMQIRQFYASNITGCFLSAIRDSVIGEEAIAQRMSAIEYSNKSIAEDIRAFLIELDSLIQEIQ